MLMCSVVNRWGEGGAGGGGGLVTEGLWAAWPSLAKLFLAGWILGSVPAQHHAFDEEAQDWMLSSPVTEGKEYDVPVCFWPCM